MPQSITFKGYKISGFATKVDNGWWSAWYIIEKNNHLARKWSFVISSNSIGVAEAAAVIHGARTVEEWTSDD
jgi:hypothetical protein